MTFRSDVASAIQSVAQTYATANPTLLKKVTRARPAGFGATPHAYVGNRPESIRHDSGTRQRTINPQLVVVSAFTDNEQQMDKMDDLADALLDAFTAAPHAISATTILEPIGIEDVEDQVGTVSYPGFAITFRAIALEGRP
jgi:hypothetical protein